jgi:putative Mg2+ transporter-C (MgtC) family protein
VNVNLEMLVLGRLTVAAILGGIVGYERAATGKRAGLRTHMLVAVGAALYVSTSDLAVDWARKFASAQGPSILQIQIAVLSPVQAIATGIGFLGAGTIFLGGHQQRVHGLTTAASIWVIAAIGIAVGCDRYLLAFGASLLTLVILHLLIRLEPHLARPDQGNGTTDQPAESSAGTTR